MNNLPDDIICEIVKNLNLRDYKNLVMSDKSSLKNLDNYTEALLNFLWETKNYDDWIYEYEMQKKIISKKYPLKNDYSKVFYEVNWRISEIKDLRKSELNTIGMTKEEYKYLQTQYILK